MDLEAQQFEDQKARRNLAAAGRRLPAAGPGLGSDGRPLFEVVGPLPACEFGGGCREERALGFRFCPSHLARVNLEA